MHVKGGWENKNKKKKSKRKKQINEMIDIKNKGKWTPLKGVKKEKEKRQVRQTQSYSCTGQELKPPAKESGLLLAFTLHIQILRGSLRQPAME